MDCPQLFTTVPHWPAQVVLSESGVQPHSPGVPPPPQVTPGPEHLVHEPPLIPHATSSSMWQFPALSQQPLEQLFASQMQANPLQRCPAGQLSSSQVQAPSA